MERFKKYYIQHKDRIDFLLPIVYFAFLLFLFIHIKQVISQPSVDVDETREQEREIKGDFKEIDIEVNILDENGQLIAAYTRELDNKDTPSELLTALRREQDMYFEQVRYLDGLKIENLLDREIPQGYSWQVYLANENVTQTMGDLPFYTRPEIRSVKIVLEKDTTSSLKN